MMSNDTGDKSTKTKYSNFCEITLKSRRIMQRSKFPDIKRNSKVFVQRICLRNVSRSPLRFPTKLVKVFSDLSLLQTCLLHRGCIAPNVLTPFSLSRHARRGYYVIHSRHEIRNCAKEIQGKKLKYLNFSNSSTEEDERTNNLKYVIDAV